jgi:hypothetical protein
MVGAVVAIAMSALGSAMPGLVAELQGRLDRSGEQSAIAANPGCQPYDVTACD